MRPCSKCGYSIENHQLYCEGCTDIANENDLIQPDPEQRSNGLQQSQAEPSERFRLADNFVEALFVSIFPAAFIGSIVFMYAYFVSTYSISGATTLALASGLLVAISMPILRIVFELIQ